MIPFFDSRSVHRALALAMLAAAAHAATSDFVASDPRVRWGARVAGPDSGYRDLGWSASRVTLRFSGTGIRVRVDTGRTWWNLSIDGAASVALRPSPTDTLVLATGLPEGIHQVVLSKRTEPMVGSARFHEFLVEGADPGLLAPPEEQGLRIEFVGNSITCGYGLHGPDPDDGFKDSTEDADSTASAIAARALGAQYRVACASGYGIYRDNGGGPKTLPGIYDLADPNQTQPWSHSNWHPDIAVVNLGTNDYGPGKPDSATFTKAYEDFLEHLVQVHPGVAIALVHGPMMYEDFPTDSLGNPLRLATHLKNLLVAVMRSAGPRLGVPIDTIVLTPQTQEVGWGGHFHPNAAQSGINGRDLEAGLRRAFPRILSGTTSASRGAVAPPVPLSWNGSGRWTLTVSDIQGRPVARFAGRGSGSTASIPLPRGLLVLRLAQDGAERTFRIAKP